MRKQKSAITIVNVLKGKSVEGNIFQKWEEEESRIEKMNES